MVSVDNKKLIWIPVYNKSCSSFISHEITLIWSIIKLPYFSTPIDDVDSRPPYFDMFVWMSSSMPEEVRNITTQSIINYAGDTYGILIGKIPNFFLVTWVQLKSSSDIFKFLIGTSTFTIETRYISTCSLNCTVYVVACLHGFRRYC